MQIKPEHRGGERRERGGKSREKEGEGEKREELGVWGKRREGRGGGGRREERGGGEGREEGEATRTPPSSSKGSVTLSDPPKTGLREAGAIVPYPRYPSAF